MQWADYLTQANAFPAYIAPQGGSTWAPTHGLHGGAAREAHRHEHEPLPVQRHRSPVRRAARSRRWPTTLNATVANGSVTFKNIGALTFGLGQLSVDLPVDLTPATTDGRYDLKDDIVLRNTTR